MSCVHATQPPDGAQANVTQLKRALHVVSSLDDRRGGEPSAVISIANAQAACGVSVCLTATTGPEDAHDGLSKLDERVRVRLFPRSRTTGRFAGSRTLRRWVKRHVDDFDVVHVHSVWTIPTYGTALRCALGKRDFILSPHGSLDPFDVQKHRRAKELLGPLFLRFVLSHARAVHCTASREASRLVTYGAAIRPVVITLPTPAFEPSPRSAGIEVRRRFGIPSDATVLLFLGRIDYKKGLTYLVEALARLPAPRPFLLIAGSGTESYERLIRSLVAERGLGDSVVYAGWVTGAEKRDVLASADVFVLLSDFENYGIAVIEAVQAGLPAVVSDEVYIADELAAAGVVAVAKRDPSDAAAVIASLLTDSGRLAQMRSAAATYTVEALAPERINRRYADLVGTNL